MSKRSVKAGSAYVEVGLKNRIAAGAQGVQRDLNKLSRSAGMFGAAMTGAAAGVLAPLIAATQGFASLGDSIDKMSLRTGVGTESLSGLKFAAEQTGAGLDMVEKGFFGLSRAFGDLVRGGAASKEAFEQIGLTLKDLQGLSAEEQLNKVADGLANIEDMAIRGSVAQQIFGRAGRQLLPLLSEGSAGIKAYADEARKLGFVMTEDGADSAAEYVDALNRVKTVAKGVQTQLGGALAPIITSTANAVAAASSGLSKYIQENQATVQAIATVAAGVGLAGASFLTFAVATKAAAISIGVTTSVVSGLGTALGVVTGISKAFAAATYASAAAIALSRGTLVGTSAALSLLSAATAANATVTGVVTAAWGVLGTVIGAVSAPTATLSALMGVLSASSVAAAGATASAWIAAAAPLIPFIAAGAAVTVVLGAVTAAAGVLLAKSIDFGAFWEKGVSMFKRTILIAGEVFSTIRAAIENAQYGKAFEAIWLGVQIAFWDGVSGAINAVKFLAVQGALTMQRFLTNILKAAVSTFKAIGQAIINPIGAVKTLSGAIASIANGAVSFSVDAKSDAARAKLKALRAEIVGLEKTSENKSKDEAKSENLKPVIADKQKLLDLEERRVEAIRAAAIRSKLDAESSRESIVMLHRELTKLQSAKGSGTLDDSQMEETKKLISEKQELLKLERQRLAELQKAGEQSRINAVEAGKNVTNMKAQIDALSSASTTGKEDRNEASRIQKSIQSKTQLAKVERERIDYLETIGELSGQEADAARDAVSGYADKIAALKQQTIELEKGSAAAERAKLAEEGLTKAQIAQVEALRQRNKALADAKRTDERKQEKVGKNIFDRTGDLKDRGFDPAAIFKETISQIDQALQSGKIKAEIAVKLKGEAVDRRASDTRQAKRDKQQKNANQFLSVLQKADDKAFDTNGDIQGQFKRVTSAIDKAFAGGGLTKDQATDAKANAVDTRDNRIESLREEGRALMEAVRSPFEVMKAELKDIERLSEKGVIDDKTKRRAVVQARQSFEDTQKKIDDSKVNGPTGTFSAFAAGVIGGGMSFERLQLKATEEVASNTRKLVKNSGKNTLARFG